MYRKALCTPPSTVHLPNNNSKFFVAIGSIPIFAALQSSLNAEVAHLVEHDLAKVGVAGSSPVFRSEGPAIRRDFFWTSEIRENYVGERKSGGGIGRHAPIQSG